MSLRLDGIVLNGKLQLKVAISSKIDIIGEIVSDIAKIESRGKIQESRGRSMVRRNTKKWWESCMNCLVKWRTWMIFSNSYHTTSIGKTKS